MLLFEYGKRQFIEPTALVNHAPNIWRWTNPDIAEASWLLSVFNITGDVDSTNVYFYSGATFDNKFMSTVESYNDLLSTEFSFWWDNTNQVAYLHVYDGTNPHSYDDLYLTRMYGATDGRTRFLNNTLYPTILKNKPTITRSVEPVVYSKLATQSITIDMQNDRICIVGDDNIPVFLHRFDDLSDIVGQITYVKYGSDTATYDQLLTLHKGVIVDYVLSPTSVSLKIDDFRTKNDNEWPTDTYEDIGYDDTEVGEDNATKVIPDGFGFQRQMPALCITQDVDVLLFDDETEAITNPPTSLVLYALTSWGGSGEKTKQNATIAKFPRYRLGKTGEASNVVTTFNATQAVHRYSGYLQYASQAEFTRVEIYGTSGSLGKIDVDFDALTYSTEGSITNVRVKFIQEDGENTIAYFSFEYALHIIGATYIFAIWIDVSGSTDTACYAAGIKVTTDRYPLFKVARTLTSVDKVYSVKDDIVTELVDIPYVHLGDGIVGLHECDAHVGGLMDADLAEICVDGVMRPETNPFDIIKELNEIVLGIPYIASLYDTAICEAEQVKLTAIGLYKDSADTISNIIEEIQNGSVIGFRYDDIDKIYIRVDDPNRDISYIVQNGQIVDLVDLKIQGNLTLYADVVTVQYSNNRRTKETIDFTNEEYKRAVIRRYRYSNPRTFPSLLATEAEAYNKSLVLLEDLSVARQIYPIRIHGLDILSSVDLFLIIKAHMQLSATRTYAGYQRVQVIGLEIDTDYEMVTLTLRQRDYSDVVADIISSPVVLIGDSTIPDAIGNATVPDILGTMEV